MLKTVICDDEPPALELMRDLLIATGEIEVVAAVQSIDEAAAVIDRGGVDLTVFDVEMPGRSGVEAYRRLTAEPKPLLIFATAHPEYALEAFDVDAIDFLLKPLDQERVGRAVEKALRLHRVIGGPSKALAVYPPESQDRAANVPTISVRDGGRTYVLRFEEIGWIEAAGDYCLLHTKDREYAVRRPMNRLQNELPADLFIRVHRSAIVSAAWVREIHPMTKGEARIVLESGAEVKSSRTYRDGVKTLSGRMK
ncbi:LytR/AlgR family response regulator transcription factor [Parvularcula maris]|uniref:LytTR family DNA-binding domain-containing protein n=1 Tax=Parvularcula maris TaxID=2965077 RepID=A0A9X2RJH5_9PROT|nr:LytTR family DNA-binding domain-containing protein [Parvularcula maris]MCQ8184727.1 LytTR family DNA-binding domain-containing protein [Parvularcula maris]